MNENANSALQLLRDIKSVTFATVDGNRPAARIIDVMLVKDDGLYFLTARGKPFYRQLKATETAAVCGMNPRYVSVRVTGDIRPRERAIVDEIFEANPVMNDLYPNEKRDILEAFQLYQGTGEIFDLSQGAPKRQRFAFGGLSIQPPGPTITESCTACGACRDACPVQAISEGDIYRINRERCLECGRCVETCPVEAIDPVEN